VERSFTNPRRKQGQTSALLAVRAGEDALRCYRCRSRRERGSVVEGDQTWRRGRV